jgi:hypothetical protein
VIVEVADLCDWSSGLFQGRDLWRGSLARIAPPGIESTKRGNTTGDRPRLGIQPGS